MPSILSVKGWRIFFFSNEGNEPVHVHCKKGSCVCKYWLLPEQFDIQKAYALGISPRDERELRKILFQHFEELVDAWNIHQRKRHESS
ncbi:MAG: DUF4160 domain-containing protein [SAR324 cluster bacterium]|nr:DUF4160 domain-containing protein [SAR324 cluster bacterium]